MNEYVNIAVTGLCAGFGSAIGNYFATNHIIKYMKKVSINGKKESE